MHNRSRGSAACQQTNPRGQVAHHPRGYCRRRNK
jgi:hypothetical protein